MKVAVKMAGRSAEVPAMTKRHLNVAHRVDLRTFQDLEAYAQPFFVLKPEHRADIARFFKRCHVIARSEATWQLLSVRSLRFARDDRELRSR